MAHQRVTGTAGWSPRQIRSATTCCARVDDFIRHAFGFVFNEGLHVHSCTSPAGCILTCSVLVFVLGPQVQDAAAASFKLNPSWANPSLWRGESARELCLGNHSEGYFSRTLCRLYRHMNVAKWPRACKSHGDLGDPRHQHCQPVAASRQWAAARTGPHLRTPEGRAFHSAHSC